MTSIDLQKEWKTAAGVRCMAKTVRNRLLGAGLKSCKARKKSFINKKQRRARLRFAKDHKDWTIEVLSKVIFSDESNFQLCPTPSRLMVRRRPGEAYKPQCLAPTVKFGGGSVMIWGCFSKAGIGQMRYCEGRMNEATYKVILEENLLPSALTMFPNSEECFFQQDNAPCHTARSVKVWMKDHQIRTLSWPAQTPDLNPIENLWNVIKRKMDGHKPSNKAPAGSGSASGSPPSRTCPENLQREAPGWHPGQMPEPPQLAPFDAEEQRLYSELPPDV